MLWRNLNEDYMENIVQISYIAAIGQDNLILGYNVGT